MISSIRKGEHRRQNRQPITGKIRVLWEDPEGRHGMERADLVDVSSHGMKIRVENRLAPRTYVSVNDRGIGVMGRGCVRYCRFEKGKYAVGLEFSGGTGWSPPVEETVSTQA